MRSDKSIEHVQTFVACLEAVIRRQNENNSLASIFPRLNASKILLIETKLVELKTCEISYAYLKSSFCDNLIKLKWENVVHLVRTFLMTRVLYPQRKLPTMNLYLDINNEGINRMFERSNLQTPISRWVTNKNSASS